MITVRFVSGDEVEGTRSIELEHRITVLHLRDRILGIAIVVVLFVHNQHRVRSVVILEQESVVDLKPHSASPVIVILRRV